MLTQRSCCLLQRQPAAGPTLGSELAGTMLCGLQLLLSSVSHARQLTFAPRTPAPLRKQLSRTSALARVGYGGVYPGRGQMSSTSSDDGGPTATPHLICKCVTVRSLYVRKDAVKYTQNRVARSRDSPSTHRRTRKCAVVSTCSLTPHPTEP